MAQVGRPRALDEVKRREVCALVATGCGIEEAARYICCAPSTIRREALRNEDFHEQLRRSELSAQLSPLRAMQQAAGTHWRAAAWLLERTNPERFARRDPVRLSPEELAAAFEKFFETINEEIADPELSRRVYNRLTAAIERSNHERWAARHRRRDPAEAKRFFPAFSPEELDQAQRDIRESLKKLNQETGRARKRK